MSKPTPTYNVRRMVKDMTLRGWNISRLAKAARVTPPTIGRFLSGDTQTAKMATKIAGALGYHVERYVSGVEVH